MIDVVRQRKIRKTQESEKTEAKVSLTRLQTLLKRKASSAVIKVSPNKKIEKKEKYLEKRQIQLKSSLTPRFEIKRTFFQKESQYLFMKNLVHIHSMKEMNIKKRLSFYKKREGNIQILQKLENKLKNETAILTKIRKILNKRKILFNIYKGKYIAPALAAGLKNKRVIELNRNKKFSFKAPKNFISRSFITMPIAQMVGAHVSSYNKTIQAPTNSAKRKKLLSPVKRKFPKKKILVLPSTVIHLEKKKSKNKKPSPPRKRSPSKAKRFFKRVGPRIPQSEGQIKKKRKKDYYTRKIDWNLLRREERAKKRRRRNRPITREEATI